MTEDYKQKLTFEKPHAVITSDGLQMDSDLVREKLKNKSLSPSAITGLQSCPARWFAETFITRDLIPEQPDNAARRGSLFHKVMEELFELPQEERTRESLEELKLSVLAGEEFGDMAQHPEVIEWLDGAIQSYYDMGGKPQSVEVAMVKDSDGVEKVGLEVFVKGHLANADREILGYVDRVILDPVRRDGSVVIEDWKTGAKVKRWNHDTKGKEGLPEARQQTIYAMLLRDNGMNVSRARLLYPVARALVPVDIDNKKFNNQVLKDIRSADTDMTVMGVKNNFPYKPSVLCAWCPMAVVCPAAEIIQRQKMLDAYAQQPRWSVLKKGFDVR